MNGLITVYLSIFPQNAVKTKHLITYLSEFNLFPENLHSVNSVMIIFSTPVDHVDAAQLTYKAAKKSGIKYCTIVIVDETITSYHACPTLDKDQLLFDKDILYGTKNKKNKFKLIKGGKED